VGELTGRLKQTLKPTATRPHVQTAGDDYLRRAVCSRVGRAQGAAPNEEKLKELLVEFEFNSIGRRLFGEEFKAGHGAGSPKSEVQSPKSPALRRASSRASNCAGVGSGGGGGGNEG